MSNIIEKIDAYLSEESEYQKWFAKKLKEAGVKSPEEFKSDEEKKKFFNMINKEWKGGKGGKKLIKIGSKKGGVYFDINTGKFIYD